MTSVYSDSNGWVWPWGVATYMYMGVHERVHVHVCWGMHVTGVCSNSNGWVWPWGVVTYMGVHERVHASSNSIRCLCTLSAGTTLCWR